MSKPIRGNLSPTKTHCKRSFEWHAASPALVRVAPGTKGTLFIHSWVDVKRKPEVDVYLVGTVEFYPGRRFKLVRVNGQEQTFPHEVLLGMGSGCTCLAARNRLTCKHLEALTQVFGVTAQRPAVAAGSDEMPF